MDILKEKGGRMNMLVDGKGGKRMAAKEMSGIGNVTGQVEMCIENK